MFQCKEWTSQESGISESLHGGTTQEVIHNNTNSKLKEKLSHKIQDTNLTTKTRKYIVQF